MLELNFDGSKEKKEIDNAYKAMCQGEVKKQTMVCESADKLSKDFEMITVNHIKPLVKALDTFLESYKDFKVVAGLNESVSTAQKIYQYLESVKKSL